MSTAEQRVGRRAEKKRRWDRENKANWYDTCECGQPKHRRSSICRGCWQRRAEERADLIVRLYEAGVPIRGIAFDLNTTVNTIFQDLDRLRKAGRIGYRYKIVNGRRVAA